MQARPIQVWTALVDSARDNERSWALLDEAERIRAARFKFDRDRRHFVAAHALKRSMLSHVCSGDPAAWTFITDRHGKPHLANRASPQFNISHCQGLVACAISLDASVGVDIEPVGRPISPGMTKVALSSVEAAWIASLAEADQDLAFIRLWTLKEAFLKATGHGLALSLQAFSFSLDPIRLTCHDPALGTSHHWTFEQRIVGRTHVLAVASPITTASVIVTAASLGSRSDPDQAAGEMSARYRPALALRPGRIAKQLDHPADSRIAQTVCGNGYYRNL